MVIGEGNFVDESLVEVVHAVVEVRVTNMNWGWCKNMSRCTDSLTCSATAWPWRCHQSRPSPTISPCPYWSEWSPGGLVTGLKLFKIFVFNFWFFHPPSTQSDVSSFELFAFSSVNVDPLKVRRENNVNFCSLPHFPFPDDIHLEDYAEQDSAKSGVITTVKVVFFRCFKADQALFLSSS